MARESLLPSFRHEVDRLFDSLIHSAWGGRPGELCWMPPADVAEEAGRYLIRMDLPGVRNSDITVAAEGRTLRVDGVREPARLKGRVRQCLAERHSGRFVRTFFLPDDAELAGIRARLTEGVLTLEIPKR